MIKFFPPPSPPPTTSSPWYLDARFQSCFIALGLFLELLLPRWSSWFMNTLSAFLPQGLCTCYVLGFKSSPQTSLYGWVPLIISALPDHSAQPLSFLPRHPVLFPSGHTSHSAKSPFSLLSAHLLFISLHSNPSSSVVWPAHRQLASV